MKILILNSAKLKVTPFIRFYIENIDRNKNEVHIIYWNRDGKEEDLSSYDGVCLHEFKRYMSDDYPLLQKVYYYFLSYRQFCSRIIKHYKFDLLIVLTAANAVVFYDLLTKEYNGRYILDYRDSTYEPRVGMFKKMVGNLIRRSQVTFTSSDGFRKYFPDACEEQVLTIHNFQAESLLHRDYVKIPSDRIRISFWGEIRCVEINKRLIECVSEDERFELHYYGREKLAAVSLKKYANAIKANNIFLNGEYVNEERYEFIKTTDIISNIYYNTNMLLAMGNKYYDSIIFRIPQICIPGSQMAQMSNYAGVGISLDPRQNGFCESLYRYYTNINRPQFDAACDAELHRVLIEQQKCVETLQTVLSQS